MKRVALKIDATAMPMEAAVPGKVLVAIKRFDVRGKALIGPYSYKRYKPRVGQWSKLYEKTKMCVTGWHVTTPKYAEAHRGERVFVVELRGSVTVTGNKAVVGQIRLICEVKAKREKCSCNDPLCFIRDVSNALLERAVRAHVRAANAKAAARD